MATVTSHVKRPAIEYPTSDGRPMAETEDHRDLMFESIYTLKMHARTARRFYVSGNLLMYYEEGNKHKHVAPDVFAVRDLSKRRRKYYLVWEEGKGPDVILELTSKSTRREDLREKFVLYRDTLKVQEYFLFDPHQEYLKPQLQGYRLLHGDYEPIQPVAGRLPSEVLGLHLEAQGSVVRFYDPAARRRLPTPEEARQKEAAARRKETAARRKEAAARRRAEAEKERALAASRELTAENERLRHELARIAHPLLKKEPHFVSKRQLSNHLEVQGGSRSCLQTVPNNLPSGSSAHKRLRWTSKADLWSRIPVCCRSGCSTGNWAS